MAWADSKIFRVFLANALSNLEAHNLATSGNTINVALYNNSITPDNDAVVASSCYNTGAWAIANEVSEAVQWPAGGVALTSQVLNPTNGSPVADAVFFDAADTASGSAADLAVVHGCLVYNTTSTTPDDQGVCYIYFGGANSVTNGTLTVVWHANGIFRITL